MFRNFKRKKKENEEVEKKPVSENKKVIGAKQVTFDGITFRSQFEGKCYLLLKASKLRFSHESEQCVLWHGFKDENIFLWSRKDKDFDRRVMTAVRDWTYTPDFVIESKDGKSKIYIEAKGNPTDLTPYKTKMFLGYLSKLGSVNGKHYEYAFVKTLTELKYVISKLEEDDKYHR